MKGLEIKIAPEESVAIYHAPTKIRVELRGGTL